MGSNLRSIRIASAVLSMRSPIWKVQPNSMIARPTPESQVRGSSVAIEGWAWSYEGVVDVSITANEGETWSKARVEDRTEFSWQKFRAKLSLSKGKHTVLARATSADGRKQPMGEGRNHVHRVQIEVL